MHALKFLYLLMYVVSAKITTSVNDLTENETNSAAFICQAIGEPVPIINWYFNQTKINVSNESIHNISISLNGTEITSLLIIAYAQSFDAGTYTCQAENFLGSDESFGILTVNGK